MSSAPLVTRGVAGSLAPVSGPHAGDGSGTYVRRRLSQPLLDVEMRLQARPHVFCPQVPSAGAESAIWGGTHLSKFILSRVVCVGAAQLPTLAGPLVSCTVELQPEAEAGACDCLNPVPVLAFRPAHVRRRHVACRGARGQGTSDPG